MRKLTKLENYLLEAGFKTMTEAAAFFGYSISIISKLGSDKYKPKARMKSYITLKLNEKFNGKKKLKESDIFPE
jgi:hypothetical protein